MIRSRRFKPITVELDGKKYSVFNDGSMYLQKYRPGVNFKKLSRVCQVSDIPGPGASEDEMKFAKHALFCLFNQNRRTLKRVSEETGRAIIQRGVVIDG